MELILDFTLNMYLFTSTKGKTVQIWQLEMRKMFKLIQFDQPDRRIKYLNNELIAVGLQNGEIQIYNIVKIELLKSISTRFFMNFLHSFSIIFKWSLFDCSEWR